MAHASRALFGCKRPNNPLIGGGVSSGNHGPPDWTKPATPLFKGTREQDTMMKLASRTGGHAYRNRSDLARAIRDGVAGAGVTFNIGFYPANEASDGNFHKLTLKVDRPGVNLRYRNGYYDLSQIDLREVALDDAVWSPLDSTAIPLTVQLKAVAGEGQVGRAGADRC